MKTGMIGLGAMGVGMARRLAGSGFLTAVYNRTAHKAEALALELNVTCCASPQELAGKVDLILLCVSADHDVMQMVDKMSKTVKPDTIVIDMSTVSSDTAQRAAALLAEKNVVFLDAPVSGGVEGAQKGTLSMMVGGDSAILDKVRPVLSSMAARITHMGGTGAGQATKAVNQIMAAGINQAVTEALAFAKAQNLPMAKVIEVISGGAAGNWFLQYRGQTMTDGVFKPGFKLALHHKDLKICKAMAEQVDLALPITDMTVSDYEQLMSSGYQDEDISALFRLKIK